MESSIEELEQKAYGLGEKYERECTGCAQTALAAIFDTLGIENDDVFRSASGLADGLGLTGDGSCGALVGGALAIGYLFGRKRQDFPDMMKPMRSYLLVKELHDEFIKKYGSCRCADLQTSLMGRTFNLLNPKQFKQALEFGMMEYCSKVVGSAAQMATRIILEEQED
ncbi:MAG: C_GCAxxG_C_C family protein [Deltaproteobacteria bacterium]|nr:C_GCAxxG_C_C family protein [Deltaproteobacteria bacterium]